MTDPEYRQDDRTDGYCPRCGATCTTVYVDASGWCPDHGRVWVNWHRAVAEATRRTYDRDPGDETDEETQP